MHSITIILFVLAVELPKLVASIELPKVEGRIDHLAYDGKEKQLFVAALGNGTLERVDVGGAKHAASLPGFTEPQGIVFLPATREVLVANGGSGDLDVVRDGVTRHLLVGADADNVRVDPRDGRIVVGYGGGALAIVSPVEWKVATRIEVGGHPESFQIASSPHRAWVNVPARRAIVVVDLDAGKTTGTIALPAAANFPMALDESTHTLLVGCRDPAKLIVVDTQTEKVVAELALSGDVDDIFLDAARNRAYAACGAGFIDVFARDEKAGWNAQDRVATAAGARTCLFVPAERRLFLAVPHRGEQRAEVRVYEVPE